MVEKFKEGVSKETRSEMGLVYKRRRHLLQEAIVHVWHHLSKGLFEWFLWTLLIHLKSWENISSARCFSSKSINLNDEKWESLPDSEWFASHRQEAASQNASGSHPSLKKTKRKWILISLYRDDRKVPGLLHGWWFCWLWVSVCTWDWVSDSSKRV